MKSSSAYVNVDKYFKVHTFPNCYTEYSVNNKYLYRQFSLYSKYLLRQKTRIKMFQRNKIYMYPYVRNNVLYYPSIVKLFEKTNFMLKMLTFFIYSNSNASQHSIRIQK